MIWDCCELAQVGVCLSCSSVDRGYSTSTVQYSSYMHVMDSRSVLEGIEYWINLILSLLPYAA